MCHERTYIWYGEHFMGLVRGTVKDFYEALLQAVYGFTEGLAVWSGG